MLPASAFVFGGSITVSVEVVFVLSCGVRLHDVNAFHVLPYDSFSIYIRKSNLFICVNVKQTFLQCVLNQGLTLQVDTPTMTSARVTHWGDTPGGHPGVTPLLFHCLRGNCFNRMQLHRVLLSGEHIFSLSKYMFTKYFILYI